MPPRGSPRCLERAGGVSPVAVPLQLPEGTGFSRREDLVDGPAQEQAGRDGQTDGWQVG